MSINNFIFLKYTFEYFSNFYEKNTKLVLFFYHAMGFTKNPFILFFIPVINPGIAKLSKIVYLRITDKDLEEIEIWLFYRITFLTLFIQLEIQIWNSMRMIFKS